MPMSGGRDYPDMPQFPTDLSLESRETYQREMQEYDQTMKSLYRSIDEDLATKQSS